jgi:hypothetical protein
MFTHPDNGLVHRPTSRLGQFPAWHSCRADAGLMMPGKPGGYRCGATEQPYEFEAEASGTYRTPPMSVICDSGTGAVKVLRPMETCSSWRLIFPLVSLA